MHPVETCRQADYEDRFWENLLSVLQLWAGNLRLPVPDVQHSGLWRWPARYRPARLGVVCMCSRR